MFDFGVERRAVEQNTYGRDVKPVCELHKGRFIHKHWEKSFKALLVALLPRLLSTCNESDLIAFQCLWKLPSLFLPPFL